MSPEIRIKDKTDALLSYTYKKGNGRLKQITYANGNTMKATYNGYGQLVAEKWYANATDTEPMAYYKYAYDNAGNIVRSIDILSSKEYNYIYEQGRITRSTVSDITVDEDRGRFSVLGSIYWLSLGGQGTVPCPRYI